LPILRSRMEYIKKIHRLVTIKKIHANTQRSNKDAEGHYTHYYGEHIAAQVYAHCMDSMAQICVNEIASGMGFVTCKAETDGDTCALCKTCACFGCRRWGYCFESSSTGWVCSGCLVYGRATVLNLGCYCRNCSAKVGAKWALEQKGLPFVATKHVMQFLWARS